MLQYQYIGIVITITAKKLCLDDVYITKTELVKLLEMQAAQSSPPSQGGVPAPAGEVVGGGQVAPQSDSGSSTGTSTPPSDNLSASTTTVTVGQPTTLVTPPAYVAVSAPAPDPTVTPDPVPVVISGPAPSADAGSAPPTGP